MMPQMRFSSGNSGFFWCLLAMPPLPPRWPGWMQEFLLAAALGVGVPAHRWRFRPPTSSLPPAGVSWNLYYGRCRLSVADYLLVECHLSIWINFSFWASSWLLRVFSAGMDRSNLTDTHQSKAGCGLPSVMNYGEHVSQILEWYRTVDQSGNEPWEIYWVRAECALL